MIKIKKIVKSRCLSVSDADTTTTRYKAMPLPAVRKSNIKRTGESISFSYKTLTARDCKKYLNTTTIIKRGYQPILVTITNNTKHAMNFDLSDCSLSTFQIQEIASAVHRDGLLRVLILDRSWFFFPLISLH